jgi:hypothetical protein
MSVVQSIDFNDVESGLRIVYIDKVCEQNRQRQQHETVLALATLGDATRNRNNPICVALPKVANASKW